MKVFATEPRPVEVVRDVTCDRCGKSLRGAHGNTNGVVISGSGAYDSTHFPDGHSFDLDVCEKCCAEWFETFKRNPLKFEVEEE